MFLLVGGIVLMDFDKRTYHLVRFPRLLPI